MISNREETTTTAAKPRASLKQLREENQHLRRIARDLAWMARRYADGRSSYAPSLYNDHARALLEMGVELNPTGDGTVWATDGDGLDGLDDEHLTPYHPVATGRLLSLPPGTRVAKEVLRVLGLPEEGASAAAALDAILALKERAERR